MAKWKISQGMPILNKEMEDAVLDALRNDKYVNGENVTKLEEEFARYIGTEHAIAVSSGTNALAFIFMAAGIKGRKCTTSPQSFIASANSILHAGGTPVFADIDKDTYCISTAEVEKQLNNGASAVLPVDIFGYPADFDSINEIAGRKNAYVIEDACQAHGAIYKGKRAGSLALAAAFSFYPSKNMTVLGDGGMVTTDDDGIANKVRKLRDAGRKSHYEHDMIGYTARLNTVNAAIGRVQLRNLDKWNAKRTGIAAEYGSRLKNVNGIKLPQLGSNGIKPVFHQYVICTKDRDRLKEHLEKNGIQCGIHYPIPIHLQPIYREMFKHKEGEYPTSESFSRECLSLPMHINLTKDDAKLICEQIEGFYGS
ncbi:MAG: DegT/DnrJ/EryC1/StrS family aminotransferase [Candidatus Micrarchaeota archaeon]|nr:DegT/DnrJ/EryC1/StrS family aminotransferase [Candidatus Micrarchaeota archaeon]MDE1824683.1 DegT/DnrJ/EryC1/StrS family aminotransferase [Candidatus Micrarchaeota archaeon]MDE1850056.1 DegT/DnrJ/EryC1/StrS family aminotransferase [Candidatus Micrarchaeota archaeon]